ncbi:hypothetical protein PVAND_005073 [Polypedilum vanderplanki]|uniref:Uncharacterized protein n=1 Tax=Polypedilum vanderplanki TaxID=319348 RepID=A0A9J6BZH2_POLVA|nr:hypothetical protein PVAND_005073 [Polypedilum vanderplanki]
MEESHLDKILNIFIEPKNRTELLLKLFHHTRVKNETKQRNDLMCKKCLTPWSLGQFTVKMKSSNHKRKARRKFKIERLQKKAKQTSKKADVTAINRKIERLKQQNNHIALYKCFCNTTTKVHLWKRKSGEEKKSKEDKDVVVTAAKTNMIENSINNKPTKKQKTKGKRNKTAGLIIPQKNTTKKSANINFSKQLSLIFQKQKEQTESLTPQSRLNQFFK